jgi:hypothetical protein
MTSQSPSIFRPEALDYRLRNRGHRSTRLQMPRIMTRPTITLAWIGLLIAIVAGFSPFLVTVPQEASGAAILPSTGHSGQLAVMIDPSLVNRVTIGTSTEIVLGRYTVRATVTSVDQQSGSTADLLAQLGSSPLLASALPDHLALIWVTPHEALPAGAPGIGTATLHVGTRRAGTYLPLVGHLFGE